MLGGLSAIYEAPDNPGARLRNGFKDVNDTQVLIAPIKDGGDSDDLSRESVSIALERARSVDKALVDWSTSLRPSWLYNVHNGRDVCRSPDYYWRYVHAYGNLWICRVWNSFRTARVKLQTSIWDLMAWATHMHGTDFSEEQSRSQDIICRMVDDVCASIPFCLGNQTPLDPEPVAWIPTRTNDGTNIFQEDKKSSHARSLGWFLCLLPVRFLLSSRLTMIRQSANSPNRSYRPAPERLTCHQIKRIGSSDNSRGSRV